MGQGGGGGRYVTPESYWILRLPSEGVVRADDSQDIGVFGNNHAVAIYQTRITFPFFCHRRG